MSKYDTLRHDWTVSEIEEIYRRPLPDLLFEAQSIHRQFHEPDEIQACQLLSVKTGGCPENCAYCPQSAHFNTSVVREPLMQVGEVIAAATAAKGAGATRFCIGGAYRDAPQGRQFDDILEMVKGIRALGMEACCTFGMLSDEQARMLANAGLTAYNHNLDTSPDYYSEIISTRTYTDRLETLARVRDAGITVCCGGIIGMGESASDRWEMLRQLSDQDPHPESVPINRLVRVAGTPMENADPIDVFELVRTIATARILMPRSTVRLSAGRNELSDEAQALCFVAGAGSIFMGNKLLTTPNPEEDRDYSLMSRLGMRFKRPASA